jgi:hypothetical protein
VAVAQQYEGEQLRMQALRKKIRRFGRVLSLIFGFVCFTSVGAWSTNTSVKVMRLSSTLERINITLGTVIRGTEFNKPETLNGKAVTNSLRSIARIFGPASILLMTDEQKYCETLPTFLGSARCESIAHCLHTDFRKPLMDCVFAKLHECTTDTGSEIIGYINSDILIFESFSRSVQATAETFNNFLMVGKRHLAVIPPDLPESDSELAIDYFVYRRNTTGVFSALPPFLIGTFRWDNVLLQLFFKEARVVVVDASLVAIVQHQQESPGGNASYHMGRPGGKYNSDLADEIMPNSEFHLGSIDRAHAKILGFEKSSKNSISVRIQLTEELKKLRIPLLR